MSSDSIVHPEALVQIVDQALADAIERSGTWLACRPGCAQCCHGVFSISALDAHRLREGLARLQTTDAALHAAVLARAEIAALRLKPAFPGDALTGQLGTAPEDIDAFDDFADEEPCPALNPDSLTCDLYAARPILCRTFGPPLQTPGAGLAVCELCFAEATPAEVERCQLDPSILQAEDDANLLYEQASLPDTPPEHAPRTIVAFALVQTKL